MSYVEEQQIASREVEALTELWGNVVGVGAEFMDFRRIHRSFGYAVCADAFNLAAKKLRACPAMSPLDICKYTSGTARNIAIAEQDNIKPLTTAAE